MMPAREVGFGLLGGVMSWSLSATAVEPDAVEERLIEQRDAGSWDEDVRAQMSAAIDAAIALAQASGEPQVNVSIMGHAPRGERDVNALAASVSGVYPGA